MPADHVSLYGVDGQIQAEVQPQIGVGPIKGDERRHRQKAVNKGGDLCEIKDIARHRPPIQFNGHLEGYRRAQAGQ
ncbi:hypothetical protein D3C75_1235770 [compost metagenome]